MVGVDPCHFIEEKVTSMLLPSDTDFFGCFSWRWLFLRGTNVEKSSDFCSVSPPWVGSVFDWVPGPLVSARKSSLKEPAMETFAEFAMRTCPHIMIYNAYTMIYHDIPIKDRYTIQLITWIIHSKVLNYRRVWNKMNILRWLERPCGAYPKYLWDRKWKESFHKPSSNGMGWPGVFSCIFQGVVGLIEVWIFSSVQWFHSLLIYHLVI